MELSYYILLLVCIIGLCMGSFYNVVILRSLAEESIVFPPSKCPICGNRLKPWHNIPVLSYIFLRGKCAFCHEKISIQYPIIEILTMLLFGFCFIKFGISYNTLFAIVIVSAFIIMSVTDLKEKLVDCNIAIALAVIGLVYNLVLTGTIIEALIGLVVGALIPEIIARIGKLITGVRALGEADTYVAGAIGACFGLQGVLIILILSLISSMVFILPMFLYKQYKEDNKPVCILTILFILSSLVFQTLAQNYLTLGLVILTGITLAVMILKSIRQSENQTYLPFVPALALGTLLYIILL